MKLKAFMTGAALALAAAVCLAPAKAEAAPEIMPDGTVFDGEYYAENGNGYGSSVCPLSGMRKD